MPRKVSTPEELAATRDDRLARRRLERQERYLSLLRLACRTRQDNAYSLVKIQEVITQAENELEGLRQRAGGRISPRKRPRKIETDATCRIFIDECGSHSLKSKDKYEAFVLGAVIVPDAEYSALKTRWKRWKITYLGSAQKKVHEPDIRERTKSFWCNGSRAKQEKAVYALTRWIDRTDYAAIACVINRPRYKEEFGTDALDESLPQHPYLMTVHFIAERLAMVLYSQFGGARGRLIVESRGPLEDANFQYEFTRLFLDGTSYVSATMFRQQFEPGIEFLGKEANSTGLQLVDILARPCGEKVIDPDSTPDRWPQLRRKVCRGQETEHSILGMKIVPWEDRYEGLWES